MSKPTTDTQTYSVPQWENQDWQNLVSQSNAQTNKDISSVDYGGIQSQIGKSTQGILGNQLNVPGMTAGISAAGDSAWTNPGTAQSYMNPYENTALKSSVDLGRQTLLNPELAGVDQSAAAAGALGGDRSQVLKGQIINNFNQSEQNQIAQGENSAYNSGQQSYETDAARRLAGSEAAAGTGIAGSSANVNTNLAATQNQLSGISASEAPEQQLQAEAGIMSSLPKQGTQTSTQTTAGGALGGIMGGVLGAASKLLKFEEGGAVSGIGAGVNRKKKTRRLKKKAKR